MDDEVKVGSTSPSARRGHAASNMRQQYDWSPSTMSLAAAAAAPALQVDEDAAVRRRRRRWWWWPWPRPHRCSGTTRTALLTLCVGATVMVMLLAAGGNSPDGILHSLLFPGVSHRDREGGAAKDTAASCGMWHMYCRRVPLDSSRAPQRSHPDLLPRKSSATSETPAATPIELIGVEDQPRGPGADTAASCLGGECKSISGFQDKPPFNLTGDHLLDGLLTPEFGYWRCRSRYELAGYHKKSSHKPSPYLLAKLRKQEALQKRCGPGTAAYKKALQRLESNAADDGDDDHCRYLVNISFRGLGNRILAVTSAFLYAVLTERVLLLNGGKDDVADLFCEPFPGATWLLPRPGRRSPLRKLDDYDGGTKESLGNMLQRGAAGVSTDGNLSWLSPPPPYVYLHLAGEYGFHDKLFYCGDHQRLLGGVPWLLMRADGYLVPGLFLTCTPPFVGELEAMFPEKDTVFYHLGRYLFHPSNAVWRAVTSYYSANLAGAGRLVGIQIRVFHEKQPPQQILDQLLSCVRDEKLLPATDNGTSSSYGVLVTSLSSWYHERLKSEYGGRLAGGVHQPSHEGRQRSRNEAHDVKALTEMYLLSMCDVLVTSGFSTFGYVAQGLGGLQPWVMSRKSPFDEWTEGQAAAAPEPPCQRALSVEPCFHSPSYYDCKARRNVELDKVTPYIRRCVDVSWGIMLVNQSRDSQW